MGVFNTFIVFLDTGTLGYGEDKLIQIPMDADLCCKCSNVGDMRIFSGKKGYLEWRESGPGASSILRVNR